MHIVTLSRATAPGSSIRRQLPVLPHPQGRAASRISTEWRPYWELDIDPHDEELRRLPGRGTDACSSGRPSTRRGPCALACGSSPTTEISRRRIHRGRSPASGAGFVQDLQPGGRRRRSNGRRARPCCRGGPAVLDARQELTVESAHDVRRHVWVSAGRCRRRRRPPRRGAGADGRWSPCRTGRRRRFVRCAGSSSIWPSSSTGPMSTTASLRVPIRTRRRPWLYPPGTRLQTASNLAITLRRLRRSDLADELPLGYSPRIAPAHPRDPTHLENREAAGADAPLLGNRCHWRWTCRAAC